MVRDRRLQSQHAAQHQAPHAQPEGQGQARLHRPRRHRLPLVRALSHVGRLRRLRPGVQVPDQCCQRQQGQQQRRQRLQLVNKSTSQQFRWELFHSNLPIARNFLT